MRRNVIMEKLNIKKLIANDIVNYGMDRTMSFQYTVSLDEFLLDYDDETKNYVKANIEEISEAIQNHEGIADLKLDKSRNEFDMVFYIDSLLTPLESKIYKSIEDQELDNNIELDEVRQVAYNMENSNDYKDLINKNINLKYGIGDR